MLAALAAATTALVVFPGLSGANASVAPDVTATGASSVTATSATLNGTVSLNDPDTDGSYTISWGTSPDDLTLGSSGGPVTAGTSNVPVNATAASLTAGTTYYYEVCALNSFGSSCDTASFRTVGPPTVSAASAGTITPTSATLSGTVNPGGGATTYSFDWGTSAGSLTNHATGTLGAGTSDQSVQKPISPLTPATTYWYELCATNGAGSNCTTPQSFFAPDKPSVTTGAASGRTTDGATLTGTVNPNGATVDHVYFEYGKTASYGTTSDASLNGTTAQVTLSGLSSGTTFHYALCAHNTWGLRCDSADHTFTTDTPPTAVLKVDKSSGTAPLAVSFDGSGSSDPDLGDSLSYNLNFGDGSTTGPTPGPVASAIPHTYTAAGSYLATLTVTDSSGAHSSDSVTITVNAPPAVSVADVSQNEGNSGSANFVFQVTLSAVSTHDVSVDYATADGTAAAGSDYTSTTGTLLIPAGTDCTTSNPVCRINVPVAGDTIYESNETFTLTLSNPIGAAIADGSATGTIVNDDQAPKLMLDNGATLEGNTGSKVSGAQSWSSGGSLQLADASGFPDSAGPHTFFISTPGSAPVGGPFTYHGIDAATNTLTNISPAGSVVAGQIAFQPRTILMSVLVCDPQKTTGNTPADCVATTSGVATTASFSTIDGRSVTTAIPVVKGQDYVAASGTLTIDPGKQTGTLSFQTIPNTTPENPVHPGDDLTRWFTVRLASPVNATIASGLGTAKIIEDDGLNQPTAATGAASSIGTDHATVAATVNPKGAATDAYVEYGTSDAYGSQTATQSLAAVSSTLTLQFSLTGLSAGTTYHYHVVATHSDGSTSYGKDLTFTTDVAPTAVLGANKTKGAIPLTVTLNGSGSSDPDGSIASWTLQFGDGKSTSGTGAVTSAIAHTYTTACSCTASLTVTDNQGAQSAAATVTIKATNSTPATGPKLSTFDTTVLGPTSARIVFPVDPNGAATQVWIEYGTKLPYDSKSDAQRIPAGAKRTLTFTLKGLSPRSLYHYRLVAWHTTDSGQTHSQDITFSTPRAKSMKITLKARSVRVNSKGVVSLPFYCKGNSLTACKGKVLLELGNLAAGSKSFSVPRTHRKLVSVKLKKAALARLLKSRRLRLDLSLSVRTGTAGFDLTTTRVTVLPPRAVHK